MDYWLVRADWGIHGGGNQFIRFIQEKIWENGYKDKYQDIVNSIDIGDTVFLADKSKIKYYAICSYNFKDGKTIEVETWFEFDTPIVFQSKGAYTKTISRIADQKFLNRILIEFNKRKFSHASVVEEIEDIESVYLNSVKIKNYFSLYDITIENLKNKREIYFVGGNGEGKTILLQGILLALKKHYPGSVIEHIREIKSSMELLIKDDKSDKYASNKNIKNVYAYGINRNKVREKYDTYGYSGIFDTSDFKDTTFLKNPLDVLRTDNNLIDDFVEKLNQDILIGSLKVIKRNHEINFDEGGHSIVFETLSEGYKSTIIWLCDLVSRLIDNQPNIERLVDFKAIVLVDEIDLYLHPKWKYSFVYSLRKVFPKIQFIMITHSTATVLGASEDAVFYKIYKENGETKVSHPMRNIKNLMANSLSTSPLFDMDTARARDNDNNLDTREDFISSKIHNIIKERTKGKKAIVEEEIIDMINQELDDYLKENDL
ncbi:MAG TPA: hypothetical protein ENK66_00755 [Arcobacter sp.]|nr:hypothetical protein [Arcobacter sp.]